MKSPKILTHITIEKLGHGGIGIASHTDGRKILIKGGLPGSVVDVKVVKQKKDYIEGHIAHIHSMDEKFLSQEKCCPHFLYEYNRSNNTLPIHKTGCGGCKRQSIDYNQQLVLKHAIVVDCCSHLLQKNPALEILPTLGSPKIFGYRNKIEFSFGKFIQQAKTHKDGNVSESIQEHRLAGFHKQGAFEKVVDIDECFLISPKMHQVYSYIKSILQKSGLPVYDIKTHLGFLRHLVIREGVHTGECMVNIVIASKHFETLPTHQRIRTQLLEQRKVDNFLQEHVSCLLITHNNGLADIVKSSDSATDIIRGDGYYHESLTLQTPDASSQALFRVSPFAFFQTNTLGAELLFSAALTMLPQITGNVVDLYCGSGTIGISCLKAGIGKKLKGIEIVAEAIRDAEHNSQLNGLQEQTTFFVGKAEEVINQANIEDILIGNDLIIVDPPREGLHPSMIGFLHTLKQQYGYTLLYISCNPVTLARDIGLLQELGTRNCNAIQPVDMFPHTQHIECISVLS